jgi:hypothetical protein
MRISPPGVGPSILTTVKNDRLFTGRVSEARAFKEALTDFDRHLADGRETASRSNVLTYYGIGGIGKSSLSQRLERWAHGQLPLINGWGPRPLTPVLETIRIDLHQSGGVVDLVPILLSLRRALSRQRRSWPTFDLAFAAYWSAVRPNQDLPNHDGGEDFAAAVQETVVNVLTDLGAAATGTALGARSMRRLVSTLRARRHRRLAFDSYEGFADFLQRCVDASPTDPRLEVAADIAGLLAWELSNLSDPPIIVVFVDTVERLKLDPRRTSEQILNRIVYNMPNVLWVMSGRDRLDWEDERRVDLPYRGLAAWPGLASDATARPRQHSVGRLSDDDAKTVMARARQQYDLPISDAVISEVVRAAGGLPQYLELARQVAINIRQHGERDVTAADVVGSIDSLVLRVLEDVPGDEQSAIRAACLFPITDTAMIAAAARTDHGTVMRAIKRPMVDKTSTIGIVRVHDEIRRAIRQAGPEIAGGWSGEDWRAAAERAVAEARRRHEAAKNSGDLTRTVEAIALAISVVCEIEVQLEPATNAAYDDWLAHALVYGPSLTAYQPLIPSRSETPYGQIVLTFIRGKSPEVPLVDRLSMLREVFDSDHPLSLAGGRHLSYGLKNCSRWDESLVVIDELVRRRPTRTHLIQRPQTLSTARRFRQALEAGQELDGPNVALRTGAYAHGDPSIYFRDIDAKISRIQDEGRQREVIEDLGSRWMRRAFFGRDFQAMDFRRFRDDCERLSHIIAIRDCLLVQVLRREPDDGNLGDVLDRLRQLDRLQNDTFGFRYAMGELIDASLAGDHDRLDRLQSEITSISTPRGRAWIPVECMLSSTGRPVPIAPTEWLIPESIVVRRWADHLSSYLRRHGVPPEFDPLDGLS